MRRVRLEQWACALYNGSMPGNQAWPIGEERDVPEGTADYLLETFPDHFVEVKAKPKPAAKPPSRAKPKRRRKPKE